MEDRSVDKVTYSMFVVPVLMEGLLKQISLGMVRSAGKSMLEWSVEELISTLDVQLEVCECHTSLIKTRIVGISSNDGRRPKEASKMESSASVLLKRVKDLLNAQVPKDVCDVCSLLGMANYSSKYIENFATITAPL